MCYVLVDGEESPTAAQFVVGDFCSFVGAPNKGQVPGRLRQSSYAGMGLRERRSKPLGATGWKALFYAIKKQPDAFNTAKLAGFSQAFAAPYALRPIDVEWPCKRIGQKTLHGPGGEARLPSGSSLYGST